jgi:hypothetical protein
MVAEALSPSSLLQKTLMCSGADPGGTDLDGKTGPVIHLVTQQVAGHDGLLGPRQLFEFLTNQWPFFDRDLETE